MKTLIIIMVSIIFTSCVSNTQDKINTPNDAEEIIDDSSEYDTTDSNAMPFDESNDKNTPIVRMPLFHADTITEKQEDDPKKIIDNANKKSLQSPVNTTIKNSLVLYNYYDQYIYSIYTTPQRVTVIRLDSKEELDGELVVGDSANWIIELDTSSSRQLIYIKPLLFNLRTNMIINTTKRTYYISLESYESTFMVAIQWRYPLEEMQQTKKKKQLIDEPIQLKNLNFRYKLISYGSDPVWKPSKVFDNGERTFIQFFSKYYAAQAPALFIINSVGASVLTNYRVVGDYYIVDTVFEKAELRLGTKKKDSILIVRE